MIISTSTVPTIITIMNAITIMPSLSNLVKPPKPLGFSWPCSTNAVATDYLGDKQSKPSGASMFMLLGFQAWLLLPVAFHAGNCRGWNMITPEEINKDTT